MSKSPSNPIIYTRLHVAALLGVSVSTVQRIEARGRLRPLKLSGSQAGRTHYRAEEVERLLNLGRGRASLA